MIGPHQTENRARGWVWHYAALGWGAGGTGDSVPFFAAGVVGAGDSARTGNAFCSHLDRVFAGAFVGIAKWRMVVNAAGAQLDYRTCVQCYTGGLFATLFLPSIIGGDVVRLAVGLRRSPNPAAVLAGNVLDRFLDMTAQGGSSASGTDIAAGIFARIFCNGGAEEHLCAGCARSRGDFVEPDV